MNLPDKKSTKLLNKKFKCDQCSLQFSTLATLTNHKRKPCVKSKISNSNHAAVKPIASKSEKKINSETEKDDYFLKPKKRLNSPNAHVNDTVDQRSIQNETKVLEQLYNYKSKKSVEQSVRDIEDLIIRDTIRNGKNLNSSQPVTVPNELPISTDNSEGYQYQQIINEFNLLKRRQRQVYQKIQELNQNYSLRILEKQNDGKSMPEIHEAIKQKNQPHFKSLQEVQNAASSIEREYKEIQRRIDDITFHIAQPMQNKKAVHQIVAELREEDERNANGLNTLKERLRKATVFSPVQNPVDNTNTKSINKKMEIYQQQIKSTEILKNIDKIRSIRTNYLKNGGNDQFFLRQLADMEKQAQYLIASQNTTDKLNTSNDKFDATPISQRVISMPQISNESRTEANQSGINLPPLENNRSTTDYAFKKHKNHMNPMKNEVSIMRYEKRARLDDAINFNPNLAGLKNESPSKLAQRLTNDFSQSNYDKKQGFIIFIDLITNLKANCTCCRVVTCLHHPKTGLGEPSILPFVNCETYVQGQRMSTVALISTKQPVPQCLPQHSLTLLIEVQLAVDDVDESKLRSCAWIKIPLFNSKNYLLEGRWRMHLKRLPIVSHFNLEHLSRLPNFEETEIFYRLVNARDAEAETNLPISPIYAHTYVASPETIQSYKVNENAPRQAETKTNTNERRSNNWMLTKRPINILNRPFIHS